MALAEETKKYEEQRFDFSLYVNDFLIAYRTFKIDDYIEGSMNTLDFKLVVDKIVRTIDDDLKFKTHVYTHYNWCDNEGNVFDEFKNPLLAPWECTFRFEVRDKKKRILVSKIWDGYGYPKFVRNRVDLTNKTVRVTTNEGQTYLFDKYTYFAENEDRLSHEMYVLKNMIMNRPDVLVEIINTICKNCSKQTDWYESLNNYTLRETYNNCDYKRNEDGSLVLDENGKPILGETTKGKTYEYSVARTNKRYFKAWEYAVADKTRKYFKSL